MVLGAIVIVVVGVLVINYFAGRKEGKTIPPVGIEKITLPGKKQVYRFFNSDGNFFRDAILLQNENVEKTEIIYHPVYPEKNTQVKGLTKEALLQQVVSNGKTILKKQSLTDIHKYLLTRADFLPNEHKRFIIPHLYKVCISKILMKTRDTLSKQIKMKID